MQNKQGLIGAIVVAIILIGGAWYVSSRPPSPSSTSTASTTPTGEASSSTPVKTPGTIYAVNTLPISPKDTLASWSFKGSHADGGTLERQVESQIASLKTKINETNPTVQEIYISIANDYELLGDGKSAYNYFLQALNSKQRYEQEDGMAWAGLGDLMQTLHAYYTAATAYGNAVKADPGEPSFHVARISFLLSYLPKETALIDAAFADAAKYVPNDASIAQLKSQYKK